METWRLRPSEPKTVQIHEMGRVRATTPAVSAREATEERRVMRTMKTTTCETCPHDEAVCPWCTGGNDTTECYAHEMVHPGYVAQAQEVNEAEEDDEAEVTCE